MKNLRRLVTARYAKAEIKIGFKFNIGELKKNF
jgi:hypothetical protein